MGSYKEKFKEKADLASAEIKTLLKEHGNKVIGEVSLSQVYQGMRGITGLVTETSLLDSQEGIRFRGYSIPELQQKLPKAKTGSEPLPEGLFHLMLFNELPTDEDVNEMTAKWQRRSHVPTHVFNTIDALPLSTHPMTMFVIGIMALQTESNFAKEYAKGMNKKDYWEHTFDDAMDLIARLPRIAAYVYQVFSLAGNRKLTEEGALFQSHIDGSKHLFTPESVMDIQRSIGADIIMAFDECPPYPSDYTYAKKSMELTHRWLDRCFKRLHETPDKYGYTQNLFPIVQGSTYKDLRQASCEYVASKGATGNAIGGLSVGEPEEMMYEHAAHCCEFLPADKPRYLMGVGTPWNILENISLGIDMFDCVMPTRNGRNAMLFTSKGVINIDNKKWEKDFSPLDDGIDSAFSQYYSKSYVRHLVKSKEILALSIASVHNLTFYLWLVKEARKHILAGDFTSWKNELIPVLKTRL